MGFGSNFKDIHYHLKEHNEGIGDGKADAEDKYEIVDDEDLVKCDHTSMSKFNLHVSLSPCSCHSYSPLALQLYAPASKVK